MGTHIVNSHKVSVMTTFVLIHGGWRWQQVAQQLRVSGHLVYTPTLTGLGERAHPTSPQITLKTQTQSEVSFCENGRTARARQ